VTKHVLKAAYVKDNGGLRKLVDKYRFVYLNKKRQIKKYAMLTVTTRICCHVTISFTMLLFRWWMCTHPIWVLTKVKRFILLKCVNWLYYFIHWL